VLEEIDVPYILFVLEAEEFAVMVGENKLHTHIVSVQARYPGFTICYLVNKLKWFLQKKDQAQYKNGESGWKCPPIEQVILFPPFFCCS
jgi:crossover junction endonuclease EME1